MPRHMAPIALAGSLAVLVAITGSTGEEVPDEVGLARSPEVRPASVLRPTTSTSSTTTSTSTTTSSTSTTMGPPSTTEAPERPPRPAPTTPVPVEAPTPISGTWSALAACESGGNWSSTVGRYDGGLQFHPATWRGHGGTEFAPSADQATPAEQVEVAERVLASQGWAAWPFCSRQLGLR